MGLAAVAVGAGVGLGVLVSGLATVMAQFIFMTSSFLHDGRPWMAGLGVWIEMFEYMEGQHITSSSGIDLDVE